MQAVIINKLGDSEVLQIADIPLPRPRQDQVRIRVLYCGVNHLDILIRQGKRPGPSVFPHILGSEVVGIIEQTTSNSNLKLGQLVAVYPWTFCGKCNPCLSGTEQICNFGGTIGRTNCGGYAECMIVDTQNIALLPKEADPSKVCAGVLAGTTAVHLANQVGALSGDSVLITGGTGGVGVLLIQLLKSLGCKILATTSSPSKIEKLKEIGVDEVYDLRDFEHKILNKYPEGIDRVVDILGGEIWSRALLTLKKNGTMSYCATTLDGSGEVPIGLAFSKQWNIKGSYGGSRADLQEAIRLISEEKINPVIDKILPLDQAAEAHRLIEQKEVFGKILLQIS